MGRGSHLEPSSRIRVLGPDSFPGTRRFPRGAVTLAVGSSRFPGAGPPVVGARARAVPARGANSRCDPSRVRGVSEIAKSVGDARDVRQQNARGGGAHRNPALGSAVTQADLGSPFLLTPSKTSQK